MAKPAKKNEKPAARRGGSTFIGILIGLVLGLFIALAVAWYINKLPNPFKGLSQPPRIDTPQPTAPQPKVTTTPPADKPKPSGDETANKPKDAAPAADKSTGETKSAEAKSTPAARETFFLQTGSFQNAPEADTLKARLALLGLEATIQTRNLQDKGIWHRVRVGPYTDVEELNRVRDILKQNNIEVALVKVREPDK